MPTIKDTVKALKRALEKMPDDASLYITYSDDVASGRVSVYLDKDSNVVEIVGSAEDL